MYLVFTRVSGELPQATQVFVVVLYDVFGAMCLCVVVAKSTSSEEFLFLFFVVAVFVSLFCRITTPDIDIVLFAFLYQLLATQSWSSQTSIFDGFISFVRVFLCKSYIVDKESGCSGFDSLIFGFDSDFDFWF